MLSGFVLIYLGIGALIAVGLTLLNLEDAKVMEPRDLAGFMIFLALTWPSLFIGEEDEPLT